MGFDIQWTQFLNGTNACKINEYCLFWHNCSKAWSQKIIGMVHGCGIQVMNGQHLIENVAIIRTDNSIHLKQ